MPALPADGRSVGGRPELVTDQELARRLRVGPAMIRRWVDGGAWPLPCAALGTTLLFRLADVECWLATGRWPDGVRFQTMRGRAPHSCPLGSGVRLASGE